MKKIIAIALVFSLGGCQNQDINEGEKFRPRELHDNFDATHFTKVTVDGVEYLMMERDNNNPHEGFGFMAFRANKLIEKQDTILSYLRSIQFFQNKIYAKMYSVSEVEAQAEFEEVLNNFLDKEKLELNELEKEELINK